MECVPLGTTKYVACTINLKSLPLLVHQVGHSFSDHSLAKKNPALLEDNTWTLGFRRTNYVVAGLVSKPVEWATPSWTNACHENLCRWPLAKKVIAFKLFPLPLLPYLFMLAFLIHFPAFSCYPRPSSGLYIWCPSSSPHQKSRIILSFFCRKTQWIFLIPHSAQGKGLHLHHRLDKYFFFNMRNILLGPVR